MSELFSHLYCESDYKTPLSKLTLALSTEEDNDRLYISHTDKGFYAYWVEWSSCSSENEHYVQDPWANPNLVVNLHLVLESRKDGAHVIHVNSSDSDPDLRGVIYEPNVKFMAAAFSLIEELEQVWCPNKETETPESNIIKFPKVEPSDTAVALSIKPLELSPLAVARLDWVVVERTVGLMKAYGLELTPSNKNLAPSIFDAVAQQRFNEFLDNQDAEAFLTLLIDYKLVRTIE